MPQNSGRDLVVEPERADAVGNILVDLLEGVGTARK